MANNIRGITIEIGGDTTKLGKALEDVNKKGKELSSELGEVNKLLKMDPGNSDLLAQKQTILADAIANTAKKLKTLEEAEEQVQEQFKRGEVSEEQVRALQREIIAATSKLENYEKAATETAEAVEKLGEESEDVKDEVKDVEKGSDKAADSLDDLADSADEAEKSSDGLGSKLKDVAKNGLAAVATAATAVVGALVGAAEESREYRTAMGKLDTAFTSAGHSSEAAKKTYQELQGILGETDQAVEAANHLAKLTTNEEELATWTNIATGIYATFGDSLPIEGLTEAANETAKTGALTGGLADALNWAGVNEEDFQAKLDACSTEQERQALIAETLTGLYSDAADKYRETNAEIIRANEANEAWSASMAEIGGVVETVLTDVKLMAASLLSEFVPSIKEATTAFRNLLNGDEGGAEQFGAAISNILTQLLGKVTELSPTIVSVGMSLLTTLITTIVSMLPDLTRTFMKLLTTIIDSLTQAAPQILTAIVDGLLGALNNLLAYLPDVIDAIYTFITALSAELPTIIENIVSWIPELITALIDALILGIPQLLNGAVQFLLAIIQAIPPTIEALVAEIPFIITSIVEVLVSNIPVLLDGALQLLQAIVDAIPLIIEALVPQIPTIVDSIITSLLDMLPVLLDASITLFMALVDATPVIIAELMKALPRIIETILSSILKAIPKLFSTAKQLFGKIVDAAGDLIKKLPENMRKIVSSITEGLKKGISKVKTIGKDIIEGLWNGIKDMGSWIKQKISGFGETVLGSIKDFFGIKSPSRVMRDQVGKMLALGLSDGITKNADEPLSAITDLTDEMLAETKALDGATINRKLTATFGNPGSEANDTNALLSRLDGIYERLNRLQIVLDTGTLVGETIDKIDSRLADRQLLSARGV